MFMVTPHVKILPPPRLTLGRWIMPVILHRDGSLVAYDVC
jgi:hypothetical protein